MGKLFAVKSRWWHCHAMVGIMVVTQSIPAAVESKTEIFGAMAKVIRGTASGEPQANFLSVPFVAPVAAAGVVTATSGSSLQDTNARWTAGAFNGTNGAFYVEFDSGLLLNILHTDGAAKRLTVPGPVEGLVAAGAAYRIRRHLTLASIFGTDPDAGWGAGPNANQADNVMLLSSDTQRTTSYFLSDVPGYAGWYSAAYAPASSLAISPAQGMICFRKATNDLIIHLQGQIKDTPLLTPMAPGYNLVGVMKSCQPLRLAELGLATAGDQSGFAAGSNPSTADNVMLVAEDGQTLSFFLSDYPSNPGWFDTRYASAATQSVPPGSAFFVHRKDPRPAFYWSTPTE